MSEAELRTIIQAAGGRFWALKYAKALLNKINRVEAVDGYAPLFAQLRQAKEQGDFRGRVLEVNFADLFIAKNISIKYGVKQGMSGDIDFCWHINNDDLVFIETKLLGQDKTTKENENQQLKSKGCYSSQILEDTWDVARIQHDILLKSTIKKFKDKPDANWINLVAIDVSELQLGTIDINDCFLAAGGNKLIKNLEFQRSSVVGIFETPPYTTAQVEWVKKNHLVSDEYCSHPRSNIHGVLFLFRNPKELSALSYDLSAEVVWNPSLINKIRARNVSDSFYKIVPQKCFK